MLTKHSIRACLVTALGVLPATGFAETYRMTTYGPPSNNLHKYSVVEFSKAVTEASGGSLTLEPYTGGALLSAKETLEGIANGVAAGGFIVSAYFPSDLPLDNVLSDASFLAEDQLVTGLAVTEVKLNNPRLQAEWRRNGVVFGGGYSSGAISIICTSEVKSVDDIAGKRVRTLGSAQLRFVEGVGGVPVAVPVTEVYTGLQRGSLDCGAGDPTTFVRAYKWAEVAKHSTKIPFGTGTTGALWIYDQDFWSSISGEDRRLLMDQMAVGLAEFLVEHQHSVNEDIEAAKNMGVTFVDPEKELLDNLVAYKDEFFKNLPAASMERRGVEDPSEIINEYLAALTKWESLLEGIDKNNPSEIAELAKREIYDKLDANSYGID